MISTEELRIGNLILGIYEDDNDNEATEIVDVVCIDPTKEITEYEIWVDGAKDQYDDFAPIPLTEEWIIKFGFEKTSHQDNDVMIYKSSRWDLILEYYEFPNNEESSWYLVEYLGQLEVKIKSVHQLQNLYFALTNKELTIK